MGYFGHRCYLKNEACEPNRCGPNSICYASYDPTGEKSATCICSEEFYGDQCEHKKLTIQIRINMTITATISNIQMYRVFLYPSFLISLQHQQVMRGLPNIIRYNYAEDNLPHIGVLKIYQGFASPKYFILFTGLTNKTINFTTTPEECPHALNLLSQSNILVLICQIQCMNIFFFVDGGSTIPAIFKYHQICKNDSRTPLFS